MHYYLISAVIIILSMVPFFLMFERKRPQAREIVLIAVLVAITVILRSIFFMIPFFKPMLAMVIISGVGLGYETGMLTGTLSAFISNFIFGQGPWTPWQMFAMGLTGLLAGVIFSKNYTYEKKKYHVCIFGIIAAVLIYGVIMDTASVLMYTGEVSFKAFMAAYISGIPINLIHALSTVIFLALLQKSMIKKLQRVKMKYKI